jgi:hypothetical protein
LHSLQHLALQSPTSEEEAVGRDQKIELLSNALFLLTGVRSHDIVCTIVIMDFQIGGKSDWIKGSGGVCPLEIMAVWLVVSGRVPVLHSPREEADWVARAKRRYA